MTVCSFEGIITSVFLDSSMVEHTAVNRGVVGSSPTRELFNMATWPSGKAKVCNTYITSSNLVVASLNSLITRSFFIAKMYVESVYLRIKFSRTGDSENKKTRRYEECQICFAINASRQLEIRDV